MYSFIVGVFVYKELDVRGAYKSFKDAIVVNGATTFMVGFSTVFAAFLTMAQIPNMIAQAILGLTDNAILILLIINIFLLIVGMFIDNIPATIILTPILLPICTGVGMHPVTFGIMLTMNLAIGFCSCLLYTSTHWNWNISRYRRPYWKISGRMRESGYCKKLITKLNHNYI